jgi:hypothetical protein
MSKEINLIEWNNLKSLKSNFFSIICFAPRKVGKSELIKYIYLECDFGNEYNYVIVISESAETLDHYSNFIHGNLFFDKFNSSILENLVIESENLETEGRPKKFLLILDDTIGNNVKNSEAIMKIYAIGRHHRISCILICQKLTLINTTVRNNSDVIFIGRTINAAEKDSIRDNLLNGLAEEEEIEKSGYKNSEKFYNALIKHNTRDYNFIVIDMMNHDKINFNDLVFRFKAKIK